MIEKNNQCTVSMSLQELFRTDLEEGCSDHLWVSRVVVGNFACIGRFLCSRTLDPNGLCKAVATIRQPHSIKEFPFRPATLHSTTFARLELKISLCNRMSSMPLSFLLNRVQTSFFLPDSFRGHRFTIFCDFESVLPPQNRT